MRKGSEGDKAVLGQDMVRITILIFIEGPDTSYQNTVYSLGFCIKEAGVILF